MTINREKGFTLIELLVVIAIIGILASVILAGLSDAQASARDSKRKQDLKQLQIALQLHWQKHGSFTQPEAMWYDTSCGETGGVSACPSNDWATNSDLRDLITDGFLNELPIDPINNFLYKYYYEPSNPSEFGYPTAGRAYILCAALETGGTFCVDDGWGG